MPLRLRISNLNKRKRIDRKGLKKAAALVLARSRRKNALIDITFVTDKKIKYLNGKYMAREGSTDVISFLLDGAGPASGKKLVGDIYISSDAAGVNAKRFKTSLKEELLLYTVHGVLHLLGFGDKTTRERRKIRKLEEKFLREVGKN